MNAFRWFATGRRRWAAISLWLAAVAGCNGKEPEAHVWGRVTFNGKPLTLGYVILMPQSEKSNTAGTGPLDDKGRFVVQSSRADVDMIPGRYSITFRPPRDLDSMRDATGRPPGYPVPTKYLDPEHPILFVDLKAEPTRLDLTLSE